MATARRRRRRRIDASMAFAVIAGPLNARDDEANGCQMAHAWLLAPGVRKSIEARNQYSEL
jgi:hypothetical protein